MRKETLETLKKLSETGVPSQRIHAAAVILKYYETGTQKVVTLALISVILCLAVALVIPV